MESENTNTTARVFAYGEEEFSRPTASFSRDEMNLAEFPLAVLSTRNNTTHGKLGAKTLEFSDRIKSKDGQVINREWIITGADKFGLPTASDDEVLLALLKLTVDRGFEERKVYFSRYEILKILRWSTEGRSYIRLQKALDRLSGVRIKATNAFYDNESKSHSTRNFGIIDAYEINDGRGANSKPSFFSWSEALFKSYKVGFIKKFDLDFYLSLESAVSRRLFRYLDKHFWYRSTITANLFILAHEKIGISRNYIYASSLKQQLDPALEELTARGFISASNYEGKGRDTAVTIFASRGKPRSESRLEDRSVNISKSTSAAVEQMDSNELQLYEKVEKALIERGIRNNQAERLLAGLEDNALARIAEIIGYFDSLVQKKSKLVSKSPVGFLYRAVERHTQFTLPHEDKEQKRFTTTQARQNFSQTSLPFRSAGTDVNFQVTGTSRVSADSDEPSQVKNRKLEASYLVERKRELMALKNSVESDLLTRIYGEVEAALVKLKVLISAPRFKEAVEHGVEEKLAKLFSIASFEEWVKAGCKFN